MVAILTLIYLSQNGPHENPEQPVPYPVKLVLISVTSVFISVMCFDIVFSDSTISVNFVSIFSNAV